MEQQQDKLDDGFFVQTTTAMRREFRALAQSESRSMSAIVRMMIARRIAARKRHTRPDDDSKAAA